MIEMELTSKQFQEDSIDTFYFSMNKAKWV